MTGWFSSQENNIMYFSGSLDSPLEKHLYAAPLWPADAHSAAPQRLTRSPGVHSVQISVKSNVFVDLFSSMAVPYQVMILNTRVMLPDRADVVVRVQITCRPRCSW
jgi:hypothetical protein